MDDLQVRAAATDIFSYLVEFSPSMVREFVMQEAQQSDDVRKTQHADVILFHLKNPKYSFSYVDKTVYLIINVF